MPPFPILNVKSHLPEVVSFAVSRKAPRFGSQALAGGRLEQGLSSRLGTAGVGDTRCPGWGSVACRRWKGRRLRMAGDSSEPVRRQRGCKQQALAGREGLIGRRYAGV